MSDPELIQMDSALFGARFRLPVDPEPDDEDEPLPLCVMVRAAEFERRAA